MNDLYGLLTNASKPIPLLGVRVEGDILGRGARVRLMQRFRNEEEKAIEAIYKFPLPEGSSVCGFRIEAGGKSIEGEVKERDEAFKDYDDALIRGDGAVLMDEERPNIFTMSVGNLKPGDEALVSLDYVILLDLEGEDIRFVLPTTIAPRYIPPHLKEGHIPEQVRLHPPYQGTVPYGLDLRLKIHQPNGIRSISSPSHPIVMNNLDSNPVEVGFASEAVSMDRDFVLHLGYKEALQSRAYSFRQGEEVFLQLDLFLKGDDLDLKEDGERETIFLMDCSGSMEGDSINQARKALEICLRALDGRTRFNIYRFGSKFETLFDHPEAYGNNTLSQALDYLKNVVADLGGTEILKPLRKIYETPLFGKSTRRDILLITDGEVGNEGEIFSLLGSGLYNTRVFPVGIGASSNEYFIRGVSRAGCGAWEFVYPGERIEPKVLRIFNRARTHHIERTLIDWGEKRVVQAPSTPALFVDKMASVFGRMSAGEPLPEKVGVQALMKGRTIRWSVEIHETEDHAAPIDLFWARERIREIEETREAFEDEGSRQRERKPQRWREEVVALSKEYGILSESTSYVAVETREEQDRHTGEMVLRKVPAAIPIGWHGMGRVMDSSFRMAQVAMAADQHVLYSELEAGPKAPKWTVRFCLLEDRKPDDTAPDRMMSKMPAHERTNILSALLSCQRFDYGLMMDKDTAARLGFRYRELKRIARRLHTGVKVDKFLLVSTAIALEILDTVCSMEKESWEGLVKKSVEWMEHVINEGRPRLGHQDLKSWIRAFVRDQVPRI